MPPRKRAASKVDAAAIPEETAVIKPSTEVGTLPQTRKSKLPRGLGFVLAVVLTLAINVVLYGFATDYIRDLTAISRLDADWPTALTLFGAKVGELVIAWTAGFDSFDVAALALLTQTPYYYLLLTFYQISTSTIATCISIDVLATSIPFFLLRGASAPHQSHAPRGSVANRSVIEDLPIQIVTSVLGAGVYASVVFAAYFTFLRRWLILHFDSLPSLTAAYDSQFFILVLVFLPVGVATKVLLFTPTTAAKRDAVDEKNAQFYAETASLADTFWYNVWGYSKRGRVLISRSVLLALIAGTTTAIRTHASIEGVDLLGATGWAATWSTAALLTGLAYGWVVGTDVLGS